MAANLFAVVRAGVVAIQPPQEFPLRDAAMAHAALESRKTTGSLVLVS